MTFKKWAGSIAVDSVVFGTFYLWQFESVDRAGDVFLFACWVSTFLMLLATFFTPPDYKHIRPRGFGAYHFASEVALIVALVWAGMVFLASLRLFAALLFEGAMQSRMKKGDQP